jgi:D-alanine--poly(phosphoribitol) ligase subunit 1
MMPEGYVYNLGSKYYGIAREHGSLAALRFPDTSEVTHDELNRRSNRVARVLLESGLVRGDVVCILNRKSVDAYACMLACLKVGVTYSNLDTTSPAKRIEKMIRTCAPVLILFDGTQADAPDYLEDHGAIRQIPLAGNAFRNAADLASDENLDITAEVLATDPAYIMFTSGSTGVPKGVGMTHGNVMNFVAWGRDALDVTTDDTLTNVNPVYFDNSVFDFYVSLFNGATMCPVDADTAKRPKDLVKAVTDGRCTIWFSVPSMLVYLLTTRALGPDDMSTFRAFVFGGEGFPKPKLKELYDLYGSRVQLVNVYGPTECTCICSSYVISNVDFEDMGELAPLGNIAPNFGYEIDPVDAEDQDFGELLLFGPNVGLGYYRDPERTTKSFIQNPFNDRFRQLTYRTGDLVRRAPNGNLHFRGRVDNQIKHMGYRIELEEIEAAFATLEYADEVAVVYKKDAQGMGKILAYVATTSDVDGKAILADVKRILPPYMVPKVVQTMPSLPKNRNGKIDRKQLQEQS